MDVESTVKIQSSERAISKYFFSEANFTDLLELLNDASQNRLGVSLTHDINILLIDVMKMVFQSKPSIRSMPLGFNRSEFILNLNKTVLSACLDTIHRELILSVSKEGSGSKSHRDGDPEQLKADRQSNNQSQKAGFEQKLNEMLLSRGSDKTRFDSQHAEKTQNNNWRNDELQQANIRESFVIPKKQEKENLESTIIDKDQDMLRKYEEMKRVREDVAQESAGAVAIGEFPVQGGRSNKPNKLKKLSSGIASLPAIPEEREIEEMESRSALDGDESFEMMEEGELPDNIWCMTTDGETSSDYEMVRQNDGLTKSLPHVIHRNTDDILPLVENKSLKANKTVSKAANDSLLALISQRIKDSQSLTFPVPTAATLQAVKSDNMLPGNMAAEIAPASSSPNVKLEGMLNLIEKLDAMNQSIERQQRTMNLMTDTLSTFSQNITMVFKQKQDEQMKSVERANSKQSLSDLTDLSDTEDSYGLDCLKRESNIYTSLKRDRTDSIETAYDFSFSPGKNKEQKILLKRAFLPIGDGIRPGCTLPVAFLSINQRKIAVQLSVQDRDYMTCDLCGLITNCDHPIRIKLSDAFNYPLKPPQDRFRINSIHPKNLRTLIETSENHGLRTGDRILFDSIINEDAALMSWYNREIGHEAFVIDSTHLEVSCRDASLACPNGEDEMHEKARMKNSGFLIKAKAQTIIITESFS